MYWPESCLLLGPTCPLQGCRLGGGGGGGAGWEPLLIWAWGHCPPPGTHLPSLQGSPEVHLIGLLATRLLPRAGQKEAADKQPLPVTAHPTYPLSCLGLGCLTSPQLALEE